MIKKIAVGVLLMLTSAAAAQPASPSPRAGGKSICVTSSLGQYDVQTIGLMVFGNKRESVSVASWGIDEMVVRKVSAILGNRYTVRRISFPKGGSSNGWGALFNNQHTEAVGALRSAAGATKCDFFLVVAKSAQQYPGTNQNLVGLGVLNHDAVIASGVFAFASVSVRLYDNATLGAKGTWNLGDAFTERWLRKIDRANWPATPQAAAQSAVLRDAALNMVSQELTEKVPKLFE